MKRKAFLNQFDAFLLILSMGLPSPAFALPLSQGREEAAPGSSELRPVSLEEGNPVLRKQVQKAVGLEESPSSEFPSTSEEFRREVAHQEKEERIATLQLLDQELRADLEKPISQRRVRPMYIRQMAYRKQRGDENHPHHVGVMISYSPVEDPIGFLPLRNVIIDRDRHVRVGVKIHYLQELMDHQEPIPLIVQRTGMSYKPGKHLDFVFIASRPVTARDIKGRQHILDERASGLDDAGLEEDAQLVQMGEQEIGRYQWIGREIMRSTGMDPRSKAEAVQMIQDRPEEDVRWLDLERIQIDRLSSRAARDSHTQLAIYIRDWDKDQVLNLFRIAEPDSTATAVLEIVAADTIPDRLAVDGIVRMQAVIEPDGRLVLFLWTSKKTRFSSRLPAALAVAAAVMKGDSEHILVIPAVPETGPIRIGRREIALFEKIIHGIAATAGFDVRFPEEAKRLFQKEPENEVVWFQSDDVRIHRLPLDQKSGQYLAVSFSAGKWDKTQVRSLFGIVSPGTTREAWIQVETADDVQISVDIFGAGWYEAHVESDGRLILIGKSKYFPLIHERLPVDIAVISSLMKTPGESGLEETKVWMGEYLQRFLNTLSSTVYLEPQPDGTVRARYQMNPRALERIFPGPDPLGTQTALALRFSELQVAAAGAGQILPEGLAHLQMLRDFIRSSEQGKTRQQIEFLRNADFTTARLLIDIGRVTERPEKFTFAALENVLDLDPQTGRIRVPQSFIDWSLVLHRAYPTAGLMTEIEINDLADDCSEFFRGALVAATGREVFDGKPETLLAVAGRLRAGLEEVLTLDRVHSVGHELRKALAGPAATISMGLRILKELPDYAGLEPEAVLKQDETAKAAYRLIQQNVYEAAKINQGFIDPKEDAALAPLRNTLGEELVGPLNLLSSLTAVQLAEIDRDRLRGDMEKLERNFSRFLEVQEELETMSHVRLVVQGKLLNVAIRASETVLLPDWHDVELFPGTYGNGLAGEAEHFQQAIRESAANRYLLVPVTPQGGEVITLYPYSAPGVTNEAQIREYLDAANAVLEPLGVRFALLAPAVQGQFQQLGFLITEGAIPEGLAPPGYTTVESSRLSPDPAAGYSPALVAAKILHPKLSWEFLKQYQLKALLLLEDKLTSARYLAILA